MYKISNVELYMYNIYMCVTKRYKNSDKTDLSHYTSDFAKTPKIFIGACNLTKTVCHKVTELITKCTIPRCFHPTESIFKS